MNENHLDTEEIISEIILLECEVTNALFKGHKANDKDEYVSHRERLFFLREILRERKVIN
jgi:hypothetical protein